MKITLEPHHHVLTQAASFTRGVATATDTGISAPPPTITRARLTRQQKRQRRNSRYEEVTVLVRSGIGQSQTSRQLGVDCRTIGGGHERRIAQRGRSLPLKCR